ncbi:MAG: DNA starvation/stationary phase protection protein Dps [Thermoplasmatota archaeon]
MIDGAAALPKESVMFPTRLAFGDGRAKVAAILNARLADSFDLFSQTKHAHWNVKGEHFFQLHLLFDKVAEIIEGNVDSIAERITALGGFAAGTARMAAGASEVEELDPSIADGISLVEALADRYAAYAGRLRKDADEVGMLGDLFTQDLLTGIGRDVEQVVYFLEAHLQGESEVVGLPRPTRAP